MPIKNLQKNSKKILVAGAAGFVGSHLCDFLIARGDYVIGIDNLSTGSKKNIAHLLRHPRFKFAKDDVARREGFKTLPYRGNIDEIYHLASPASPAYYQQNPINTWKANTIGTLNLLQLEKKYRAKFLFASTSEVYGDPLQHPQTESYFGNVNPVGIRSCYDESKRAGESLCMDYYRQFNSQIKIVRIFNTYGPRMDKNDGRVVSNFITQALANEPITIYGTGRQTRSFQYVDDLIGGLIKMMASPKSFVGPVNIGNPGEFTVLELAKKIIKFTGSKSSIIYKPLPQDDPNQRKPDIALAKQVLNWQSKINLEVGLKSTIEYFKRNA